MHALPETTTHERVGRSSTERREAARSIAHHKHQMFGHSRAGLTRGVCRVQAPAAYEPQACELGGRVDRPSFSRIRHRQQFLPLPQLRARAIVGCASLFHSHRFPVSPYWLNRSGSVCSLAQTRTYSAKARPASQTIRNTLSHQPLVNDAADALHVQVLPSSLICCINKCQQARTNNCHSVTQGEKCKPL